MFSLYHYSFNFVYNTTYKKYNQYTNKKMILKDCSKGQKRPEENTPIKQNQKEIRYKTHSLPN